MLLHAALLFEGTLEWCAHSLKFKEGGMGEVRVEQRRISETTTIRGCFESEKPLKSTHQLHSQIRLFLIERLGYVKAG